MFQRLTLFDLIWLNLVAVASLRWTASAASNGPASLTLWLFATVVFFVPQGLAVAELSSRFPEEGGLYRWTQRALGAKHGYLCGWCYWINSLIYFPSLLLYVCGNFAYTLSALHFGEALEQNKFFVITITLLCLWLVAGLSILGVKASRWLQNAGGMGNWVPPAIVATLAAIAYFTRGSATPLNLSTLAPRLKSVEDFSFFSQMCFALAGLELVTFLGRDIENPRKTITRSIVISGILITLVYIVGTLGILISVPQDKISVVNGIVVAIQEVATPMGIPWLAKVAGLLITLAGIGCLMAWFSGAARVPYLVGVDHYLPSSFGKLHPKFQTPYVAILTQTIIATLFTLFATAGTSTRLESAYKLLVDMCLVLYFIPYCYLFVSLYLLRKSEKDTTSFQIPFGSAGKMWVAGCGLVTTIIAIATSFVPSSQDINWELPLKTAGGTAAMLLIGIFLYAIQSKRNIPESTTSGLKKQTLHPTGEVLHVP